MKQTANAWHFDFGLCTASRGKQVPREKAEELMRVIQEWAKRNKFDLGGGFHFHN